MRNRVRQLWYRGVAFARPERNRFLRIVATQVNAGLSLSQVMDNLSRWGHNTAIRRLAEESLGQHLDSGLLTGGWDRSPFWPERDALLLQSAERNNALPEMAAVLEDLGDDRLSVWQAVWLPNLIWIGALLFMVAILLAMMTQLPLLEQYMDAPPRFAVYGHFLIAWGPLLLVVTAGLLVLYHAASRRLPVAQRRWGYPLLLFRTADRVFAMSVCGLLAILLRQGESRVAALDTIRRLYRQHPHHDALLSQAIGGLNSGLTLPQSLRGGVLEARYADFLQSLAPNGDSQSLAKGLPAVGDLLREDARSTLQDLRLMVVWITSAGTAAIIFALLPVMLGQGLTFT